MCAYFHGLPTHLFRIAHMYKACVLCVRYSVGMLDIKSSQQRYLPWSSVTDRTLAGIILTQQEMCYKKGPLGHRKGIQ